MIHFYPYHRRLLTAGLVVLLVLQPFAALTVRAQGDDHPLLQYNEPAIVTLPSGQSVIRSFLAMQGDSFEVRLWPLTGFDFTALLLDPAQQLTQLLPGDDGNVVFAVPSAGHSGRYALVLQATGGQGEMLIQVNSSALPPAPLAIGLTELDLGSAGARFSLPAQPTAGETLLALHAAAPTSPGTPVPLPEILLIQPETGKTVLAASGGFSSGLSVSLPAQVSFLLVFLPAPAPLRLHLTWGPATGAGGLPTIPLAGATATPAVATLPPTPTPIQTLPPTLAPQSGAVAGQCQVSFSGAVNIRSGPSVQYPAIAAGMPGVVLAVTGRSPDGAWWQVDLGSGLEGWVSNLIEQVITQGNCAGIPQGSFAPLPTATLTPTFTATFAPTATFTPTYTPTLPMVATLNFSLPPVNGSSALTSGFVPDPYAIFISAGGPVDVSYLGGGCSGFTASAPSFSLNYTSGAFPLLRFYFIGTSDTTLVINSPAGSYFCVDDSFGTLNPTIDFNSPASGRYDVWVGSFAQGVPVSGTLYITESSSNHP